MKRWILISMLLCPGVVSAEEKTVAGRTLAGWVKDVDNPNIFVRLRAVKSMGPFGADAIKPLIRALDDEEPGVRYQAADMLGAIGPKASDAVARLKEIKSEKDAPGVAMAAAFALCRIEGPKGHIGLLTDRLSYGERAMACKAAEFLSRLGDAGKSAIPALEAAYMKNRARPGDYHIRGATQNALRKLKPGWKKSH